MSEQLDWGKVYELFTEATRDADAARMRELGMNRELYAIVHVNHDFLKLERHGGTYEQ